MHQIPISGFSSVFFAVIYFAGNIAGLSVIGSTRFDSMIRIVIASNVSGLSYPNSLALPSTLVLSRLVPPLESFRLSMVVRARRIRSECSVKLASRHEPGIHEEPRLSFLKEPTSRRILRVPDRITFLAF